MTNTKVTASEEIQKVARDEGFKVEVGRVEVYRTWRKGFGSTEHRLFPIFITLSEEQAAADQADHRNSRFHPFTVLFNENGSFFRAFNQSAVSSVSEFDARIERVRADRLQRGYKETEGALSDARYAAVRGSATYVKAYGKGEVLETLSWDNPIKRQARNAERVAQDRAKEIERLTQVRDNNRRVVEEKSDAAATHLEALRVKLVACHPSFETAPGLVDTILLEILGTDNADDNPAQQFFNARAGISQAIAEAAKAEELLAKLQNEGA